MLRWLHRLNAQEFEQTLGDSEGQGSLACCSLWGHKESDMTYQLNSNEKKESGTKQFSKNEYQFFTDSFKKIEEEEIRPKSLYEAIIVTPKPEKDITRKENYRSMCLINIHEKIQNPKSKKSKLQNTKYFKSNPGKQKENIQHDQGDLSLE